VTLERTDGLGGLTQDAWYQLCRDKRWCPRCCKRNPVPAAPDRSLCEMHLLRMRKQALARYHRLKEGQEN
jgi:hypothetical protein